jgi:hypothetical protein
LGRLAHLLPETGTVCFAWALIPNHFHLLLKTGSVPIAVFMNRLLTGYAGWFNRKYKRHGQLFQNRYKSILCQEDSYLKELIRYIHLNPVRARIVETMDELEKHPWCGHSVLMNRTQHQWQDTDYVLTIFSDQIKTARKRYRAFVAKGANEDKRPELTGGGLLRSNGGWTGLKGLRKAGVRVKGDEKILGDSDFVANVLRGAQEKLEHRYELKIRGFDFNSAIERVARVLSIERDQVTAPGKAPLRVKARALLCYWVHRELGMTTVEIAKRLGLCQSAASRLAMRGERIAKEGGLKLIDR